MSAAETFFDSNVILYLVSADAAKAERAEDVLAGGGIVSTQVLNEIASVVRRKYRLDWTVLRDLLAVVQEVCAVVPLSLQIHRRGLALSERHGFGIHDSMILAAALESGCTTLYTEDLHAGQQISGLTIRNPFADIREIG